MANLRRLGNFEHPLLDLYIHKYAHLLVLGSQHCATFAFTSHFQIAILQRLWAPWISSKFLHICTKGIKLFWTAGFVRTVLIKTGLPKIWGKSDSGTSDTQP